MRVWRRREYPASRPLMSDENAARQEYEQKRKLAGALVDQSYQAPVIQDIDDHGLP